MHRFTSVGLRERDNERVLTFAAAVKTVLTGS
jgi:hypothetical protein